MDRAEFGGRLVVAGAGFLLNPGAAVDMRVPTHKQVFPVTVDVDEGDRAPEPGHQLDPFLLAV